MLLIYAKDPHFFFSCNRERERRERRLVSNTKEVLTRRHSHGARAEKKIYKDFLSNGKTFGGASNNQIFVAVQNNSDFSLVMGPAGSIGGPRGRKVGPLVT